MNMKNDAQQVKIVIDKFTVIGNHVQNEWYNIMHIWNFKKLKESKMRNLNASILYI